MSNALDLKLSIPNSIEKLHHAYCLEGKREDVLKELLGFLEEVLKFAIKGNPDFYSGEFDTLGIDEGRIINEMQSRKAVFASRRVFIISVNFITREAQNSLLKMFEEPAGGAVFFLIISSASLLLPTLRSRMIIINLNRGAKTVRIEENENFFNAKKFIKSSPAVRMAMAKRISDEVSDGKASKSAVADFLNSLEKEILNQSATVVLKRKNLSIFEEIDKCRSYANDRSPSIKMLLEHIAIMI